MEKYNIFQGKSFLKINEFKIDVVKTILKYSPNYTSDILGAIADCIGQQAQKIINEEPDIEYELSILNALNDHGFVEDLKIILNESNDLLVASKSENKTELMSTILIQSLEEVFIYIERIKLGEFFDADYLKEKININYIHEDFVKLIAGNINDTDSDFECVIEGKITEKNMNEVMDLIEENKRFFDEKGLTLEAFIIDNNRTLFKDLDSLPKGGVVQGVYVRLVDYQKNLVFTSQWLNDIKSVVVFIENQLRLL